jgi:hypothetical protein
MKKTIHVQLKQQGKQAKQDYTKPQLTIELNFTQENAQLDKLYAINLMPWDDDESIDVTIWEYEEYTPMFKYTAIFSPEKVHGLFQVYSLIGGEGLIREPIAVTDDMTECLKALEKTLIKKVRYYLGV